MKANCTEACFAWAMSPNEDVSWATQLPLMGKKKKKLHRIIYDKALINCSSQTHTFGLFVIVWCVQLFYRNVGEKKSSASALPLSLAAARFQILSSQTLNNSYTFIGGYLTHDRQTVRISSERCLEAPLTVKPIRASSPRHQSLAPHFTSFIWLFLVS